METIWIEEATLMVALLCANYYVYSNAYGACCQVGSGVCILAVVYFFQVSKRCGNTGCGVFKQGI